MGTTWSSWPDRYETRWKATPVGNAPNGEAGSGCGIGNNGWLVHPARTTVATMRNPMESQGDGS
jgi:hypothetical protein